MSQPSNNPDRVLEDIRYILKDLLKVIKVVSMYPEDNPLPQSLKQSFAEKLESVAAEFGPIDVIVEKDVLTYKNEVVFRDRSKEESLAGLFFHTGITRFTFKETLSVEDIYKLLETFKQYLNAPRNSCDLAGMIWEAGIADFPFSTVEDIALSGYDGSLEADMFGKSQPDASDHRSLFGSDDSVSYNSIFDHASGLGATELVEPGESHPDEESSGKIPEGGSVFYAHVYRDLDEESVANELNLEQKLNTSAAADAMGFADLAPANTPPNTAFILNDEFKLSEEEEQDFVQMLDEDNYFDMFESTVEILKEILHQETAFVGFNESVTICEKILSDLIRAGALENATELLNYLRELDGRIRSTMPQWADRLKEATITAGSRDRLQFLAESLNDQPDLDEQKLNRYLANLGWESLGGITDLLGDIQHRSHREAICNYLSREGKNKVDLISRGIFNKRWFVVRNSAAILARIGDDKSLGYLKKILHHEDRRVRLAIVENLKESSNERALDILSQAVMDPDPEVKRMSVQSVITYKGEAAFDKMDTIVHEQEFSTFEPEVQAQLLRAYSILGGDRTVRHLRRIILKFNLSRNSSLSFLRKAAFEALAHNRSEKAEKELLKLSGSWRMNIKSLAIAAMHRRRSIMYGDDDANDS